MFANKRRAVPGALDNLSAVAPVMCIAKILKEWKENYPDLYPNNTEVQVVVTGCEECGCKGAEQFAIKHAEEYNKIDTTAVNMDTMAESRVQSIFNKEGLQDFPPEINDLLIECCNELGYKYSIGACPPVAGGTDARGFMKYGLRASSLIGLNYKWYHHWYHTDRDNLDLVNKERRPLEEGGTSWKDFNVRGAMEMALKICLKYLEKKDKE
jgi:Zn-dependent M28 family amino/carboxypeptidase